MSARLARAEAVRARLPVKNSISSTLFRQRGRYTNVDVASLCSVGPTRRARQHAWPQVLDSTSRDTKRTKPLATCNVAIQRCFDGADAVLLCSKRCTCHVEAHGELARQFNHAIGLDCAGATSMHRRSNLPASRAIHAKITKSAVHWSPSCLGRLA